MWPYEIEAEGSEKQARYMREAEVARLLGQVPWRTRLAGVLRAWAEWLEPAPKEGWQPLTERHTRRAG